MTQRRETWSRKGKQWCKSLSADTCFCSTERRRDSSHWKPLPDAEDDAKLKEEVFGLDATTRQEVLRAVAEAEVARHRLAEAEQELELARFDLDACRVKAPFTGYLAAKHKQPEESVERLEKIFTIVDTSKVYAVANVPEDLLPFFPRGAEAIFVSGLGKAVDGQIERMGKVIDPKSRTKRVYLLIDNPRNELEVGMTGSLRLPK